MSSLQGVYPTIIVILIHSKHSALDSSIGSMTGVSSGMGFKHSTTELSRTTLHTDTSRTTRGARETEIDLFEMARTTSSRDDIKNDVLKTPQTAVDYQLPQLP